ITCRELVAALHEELAALPEQYRAPLILCHLEGQRQSEVARRLGCPIRTLERRLQKARELMQARLARRGFTLSVTALGAVLLQNSPAPALPPLLTANTVRAPPLLAAGTPLAAGLASTHAAVLANGLRSLAGWTKVKVSLATILTAAVLITGGAVARQVV